jgi:hypothetical protein
VTGLYFHADTCAVGSAVAVGGTVHFWLEPIDDRPLVAFDAVSSSPAVLEVGTNEHGVTVTGRTPGTAYVRVLDAGGQLLDRLPIEVATIARARLAASGGRLFEPVSPDDALYFPGARARFRPTVVDGDGRELADRALTIVAASEPFTGTTCDLDTVTGDGGFAVALDVGGGRAYAGVGVATSIDAIALEASTAWFVRGRSPEGRLILPDGARFSVGARLHGAPVLGAPLTARLDGVDVDAPSPLAVTLPEVDGSRVVVLTVSHGDVADRFEIEVVDDDPPGAAAGPLTGPPDSGTSGPRFLGERAFRYLAAPAGSGGV